ncbi:hypothetical protein LCGC14_0920550 [marine sediment metagenome]|uniref:NTP pyrophosphohydrolase MazG-like domain-containing protein n=1 Tax=marine sediment metagenome TaxID=412755 RepID=A0A0F9NR28_9ZZZZ
MPRVQITSAHIAHADAGVRDEMRRQIQEKGDLSFCSSHESLGVIGEEHKELGDAIQANDREQIKKELRDIVVAATWALASETAGGWDW